SIGTIQRALLEVEQQGGGQFFGEPMLDIDDLLQTDRGRGVVNLLAAEELIRSPKIYATFLLWMLSELFERLPEVGDPPKPTLVSLLDEKGSPGITERAWILTPSSRIGPLSDAERDEIRRRSTAAYGHYEQTVDRESAYEKLKDRTTAKSAPPGTVAGAPPQAPTASSSSVLTSILFGS